MSNIRSNQYSLEEFMFVENDTEIRSIHDKDQVNYPSFLKIYGHESQENKSTFSLWFRALGVKNVEKGFFNLSRTDPLFIISKKHESPTHGVHWQAVYQSAHILDHLNPLWKEEQNINLEQLCDGDLDKMLQIEIWDYESTGKNRLVGVLKEELSLRQLLQRKAIKGNADRTNALEIIEVVDEQEQKITILPNPLDKLQKMESARLIFQNDPTPAGVLVVL